MHNSVWRTPRCVFPVLFGLSLVGPLAHAQPPAVPTQHNDNARTGANTRETTLTPANVNVNTFGKLFTRTVDANVNGQVLYVPNLTIGGAVHNVIFCSTSNNTDNSPNSVYAFDADNPGASTPLWKHTFPANSARWTTCAPVIDTASNIIYVLTKDRDDNGPHKLHALDLLTGNEKTGSPVTIAASIPGTGAGSSNGVVTFDTTHANCRPALLLLNGIVYFAIAHNTDSPPYHGWVFGYRYDGTQFTQTGVFNTCPNGSEAGVWQAGKGLAADANGNIYFSTGNGTFTANTGGNSYGMCYVKLSTPNLTVVDYFAPHDEQSLSDADLDLGNSGVLNIPGTNRIFGGASKFGSAFLLDSTNLGGFTSGGPDKAVQRIDSVSSSSNVGQNPVAWDTGGTKYVYVWPKSSQILQYKYDPAVSKFNPAGVWKQTGGSTAGGALAVSANNGTNGILWGVGRDNIVYAFDATDLSHTELWDSNQNSGRDALGSIGKWQFPTVVNGRVYVPTGAHTIVAYGLLSTRNPVTLTPIADSYIRSGSLANTNYGSSDQIAVKQDRTNSNGDYNRISYLKFDLTAITTAPASAVLNLTVQSGANPRGSTETVEFYDVADTSWTEGAITWNNAPGLNRTNVTSTGTLVTRQGIVINPGTVSIDVTSFVAAHLGQIATLQLKDAANENLYLTFNSKESKGTKPNLVVTP